MMFFPDDAPDVNLPSSNSGAPQPVVGGTPREAAVYVLKVGLRPIPIYPKGSVRKNGTVREGKEPIGVAWGAERNTVIDLYNTFHKWPDTAGRARRGRTCRGATRRDRARSARRDRAWMGQTRQGSEGEAAPDAARHGPARLGWTGLRGRRRRRSAGHGEARPDMARLRRQFHHDQIFT
jgi:hypothetical protein